MTIRYSCYESYRGTSIPWLGSIPYHWQALQLRRLFRIVNGATPASGVDTFWGGDVPWVTPDDLGKDRSPYLSRTRRTLTLEGYQSCGTNLVPAGSLVLSSRAPVGYVAITSIPLCTNQGCKSLVPANDLDSRFFYYQLLISGDVLESLSAGSTFKELSASSLASFILAAPPLPEQHTIAAFLDYETARIDRLIEKQQGLIELLQEKRQAVISDVVTKGLNPDVPMKDSGIDWLGEVPAHWEVAQLRYVVAYGTKVTYGIVQAGPHVEDGVPYIRTGDMVGTELPLEGYLRTSSEIDQAYTRSKVRMGDLVVAIRATVGKALLVPPQLDGANLTQGTARVAPGDDVHGEYLLRWFESWKVQRHLGSIAKGATFKEITLEMLRRLTVAVPPLDEQRQIENHMCETVEKLSTLKSKAEQTVSYLQEHRTALISAAVTGKIDVRDWKTSSDVSDEELLEAAEERATYG